MTTVEMAVARLVPTGPSHCVESSVMIAATAMFARVPPIKMVVKNRVISFRRLWRAPPSFFSCMAISFIFHGQRVVIAVSESEKKQAAERSPNSGSPLLLKKEATSVNLFQSASAFDAISRLNDSWSSGKNAASPVASANGVYPRYCRAPIPSRTAGSPAPGSGSRFLSAAPRESHRSLRNLLPTEFLTHEADFPILCRKRASSLSSSRWLQKLSWLWWW
mmetsp:Transcript_16213/g.39946  ORF Transcript_16213/g.39946 Transcript_16213/m.39946 type:complete len:220 (+) Transcript_16213:169-828(+)